MATPKPQPRKPKSGGVANLHNISRALNILRHSSPSNDAESLSVIKLMEFAVRTDSSPALNSVANYLAEAVVYNRVNVTHLFDAKRLSAREVVK